MDGQLTNLCFNCLGVFNSKEGVLLESESPIELLSSSCPLCAIVDFDLSIHQKPFTSIRHNLEETESGRRVLYLWFWFNNEFAHQRRLFIQPENGESSVYAVDWMLTAHLCTDTIVDPSWAAPSPRNTLSDRSIAFLKNQLKICQEQHENCQRDPATRPTRLLRIEPSRNSSDCSQSRIYLDDGTAPCVYISLSHCWGASQPLRLTNSTEPALRAGISSQELPRTFSDAVAVCQQLDVSHIRIDSLCIFQDKPQDWAVEAAAMHSVYTNALCNLAATGASDSSIGFYFERNPIAHLPFRVPTEVPDRWDWAFPTDWTSDVISESPLNKRAWVLQERLLSSRIVHFTRAGIYWECLTHVCSETPQYVPHAEQPEAALTHSHLKRTMAYAQQSQQLFANPIVSKLENSDLQDMENLAQEANDTVQSTWLRQLASYTECGITKDTDRLVALEGLSQWFSQNLKIKMIYGLLDHHLIRELAWEVATWSARRRDPPVLPFWRAPSWSWASANYRVTANQYCQEHSDCVALREIADIVSVDRHTVSSTREKLASLILRGRVLDVRLSMEGFEYWVDSETVLKCADGEIRINSRHIVFDRLPDFPYEGELTLLALMECHCRKGGIGHGDVAFARPTMAALILRRLPTAPVAYNRVGILRLEGSVTEGLSNHICACKWYHSKASSGLHNVVIV
jgi:hypothetical protein